MIEITVSSSYINEHYRSHTCASSFYEPEQKLISKIATFHNYTPMPNCASFPLEQRFSV